MYKTLKIKESKDTEKIEIDKDRLLWVEDTSADKFIQPRIYGTFADRGYILDSSLDWIIGKDDRDELVLIPLKKER